MRGPWRWWGRERREFVFMFFSPFVFSKRRARGGRPPFPFAQRLHLSSGHQFPMTKRGGGGLPCPSVIDHTTLLSSSSLPVAFAHNHNFTSSSLITPKCSNSTAPRNRHRFTFVVCIRILSLTAYIHLPIPLHDRAAICPE